MTTEGPFMDLEQRLAAYREAVDHGWLTPNEVRAIEEEED